VPPPLNYSVALEFYRFYFTRLDGRDFSRAKKRSFLFLSLFFFTEKHFTRAESALREISPRA
jgi:hypothetical protein